MSAPLSFLILKKLKNQIKSFFKSPGKIIYLVFIIGILGLTIFSGSRPGGDEKPVRDLRELGALVTAFYSMMFVLLSYKGFSSGASMFSMADVNLIFPAPFQQRKVLFFGLFQQLGTSLLLGLFLLFQYSWLHNVYGIGYGTLLVILLGYAVTVFLGQITAMVIYCFTSADEKRRSVVKGAYFGVIGCFLLFLALRCAGGQGDLMARAAEAVNGAAGKLFPVSGWAGRAVSGVFLQHLADVMLGLVLCAVYLALLVCLITYGKQDYYEDVLKSSEIAQSAITARKEGRVGDAAPNHVRIGKTGIGRGAGASALYYKHRLENRRSRLLILEPVALTFAVITVAMSIFMKQAGIVAVMSTAAGMQIFTVALGRFNKELTKPYIYLMPEPPLKKMLFALAEALPSAVFESVLIFVPVAFIMGLDPLITVLCIAARVSFTFLFTCANIVVERLWGGAGSRTLVMFLYMAILAVMAAPGIAVSIIITAANPGLNEAVAVFLSLIACNIPVSVLALFFCRNMLQYAELNQR